MVQYKGYEYEIISSTDNNGKKLSITPVEELSVAKELDTFLSTVEEHTDEEIENLKVLKNIEGLTDRVKSKLYDLFFDLCYYGNREKEWLLNEFKITEKELGKILM